MRRRQFYVNPWQGLAQSLYARPSAMPVKNGCGLSRWQKKAHWTPT